MESLLEPCEFIEGIGDTYAARLSASGVHTVGDVLASTVSKLSGISQAGSVRCQDWQDAARLLSLPNLSHNDVEALVKASVHDVRDFARLSLSSLTEILGNPTDDVARAWQLSASVERDVIVVGELEEDTEYEISVGYQRFPTSGSRFVARVAPGNAQYRVTASDGRTTLIDVQGKAGSVVRNKIRNLPNIPSHTVVEDKRKLAIPHAHIKLEKVEPDALSEGSILRVLPDRPDRAVLLSRKYEQGVLKTIRVELGHSQVPGSVIRYSDGKFETVSTDFSRWSEENL